MVVQLVSLPRLPALLALWVVTARVAPLPPARLERMARRLDCLHLQVVPRVHSDTIAPGASALPVPRACLAPLRDYQLRRARPPARQVAIASTTSKRRAPLVYMVPALGWAARHAADPVQQGITVPVDPRHRQQIPAVRQPCFAPLEQLFQWASDLETIPRQPHCLHRCEPGRRCVLRKCNAAMV
jgi:hypothetical protein